MSEAQINSSEGSPHDFWMARAWQAAARSNCIRRAVGAVLVRDGQIIAEGWNGVAGEYPDCRAAGCRRCIEGGATGSGYESCICIHAEQSAVAQAARNGIATEGSSLYVNLRPCLQCLTLCLAAGVNRVFFAGDSWEYPSEVERIYCVLCHQLDEFARIDNSVAALED